jgi:hypothetical protein
MSEREGTPLSITHIYKRQRDKNRERVCVCERERERESDACINPSFTNGRDNECLCLNVQSGVHLDRKSASALRHRLV